jgi:hypothetical protein
MRYFLNRVVSMTNSFQPHTHTHIS